MTRPGRERRKETNLNDIRVEVPEFKGRLDPDEFLEWLHSVERVFLLEGGSQEQKSKACCP